MALYKCQIVIAGDLNIHIEKESDAAGIRLLDLLGSFDCVQHISEPTHAAGGTLDHVYTRSGEAVVDVGVESAGSLSDHSFITWRLRFIPESSSSHEEECQALEKLGSSCFSSGAR